MTTPEAKVKAAIRKRLSELGFWQAGAAQPKGKVCGWFYMPVPNGMGASGIPDFMGSYINWLGEPRPFAVEAKAPGGKPTPIQLERHKEMTAAGWRILVVSDVSQLNELEDDLCER